jgi:ThiF family
VQKLDKITDLISKISFVRLISDVEILNNIITGKVEILFNGLEAPLGFEIMIYPEYPLKCYGSETIKFINKELIQYKHVMRDGGICIHTSYNPDLKQKLQIDFDSLKTWIQKYFINIDQDLRYEHIIVPEEPIDDCFNSYIFTNVNKEFKKAEFGSVDINYLHDGIYKGKKIFNNLVHSFTEINGNVIPCKWSSFYIKKKITQKGLYIFIEDHPAIYNRFAFQHWKEFETFFSSEYLKYLFDFEKSIVANFQDKKIPLFIGYNTVNKEIHWQVAILKIGNFPLEIKYTPTGGIFRPEIEIKNEEVKWEITHNSSYSFLFGRGTFCEKFTQSKILIIGIGAIGSMLARTLVKSGCIQIDIADYDIKNPENVCRSEYTFNSGLNDKVWEFQSHLISHSPFVEVNILNNNAFESFIKSFFNRDPKTTHNIATVLNQYDIIFDCTTDNDLMYVLNYLQLKCDLINLSITNHAKDLVCAFSPNIYNFVNTQFSSIFENDIEDLYEPTGCWSPTFKASYNDINLHVQMALKHMNNLYKNDKPKNNFVIHAIEKNGLQMKLEEF